MKARPPFQPCVQISRTRLSCCAERASAGRSTRAGVTAPRSARPCACAGGSRGSRSPPCPRRDPPASSYPGVAPPHVAARVLAPSVEAFDAPLGPRGLPHQSGACYRALRRLPGRDSHPLETCSLRSLPYPANGARDRARHGAPCPWTLLSSSSPDAMHSTEARLHRRRSRPLRRAVTSSASP